MVIANSLSLASPTTICQKPVAHPAHSATHWIGQLNRWICAANASSNRDAMQANYLGNTHIVWVLDLLDFVGGTPNHDLT